MTANRTIPTPTQAILLVAAIILAAAPCLAQDAQPPAPADPNLANATPLAATLTEIHGDYAQVSHDNGQSWQPAATGLQLAEDAMVRTGFATRVSLSFHEETVINLDPLSCVRVAQYRQSADTRTVRADLPYGAVRAGVTHGRLEADTEIRTPVSTLSVRGTIVYVSYLPGYHRTLLRVVEDGPAIATRRRLVPQPWNLLESSAPSNRRSSRSYTLNQGMFTDSFLSRYLEMVGFGRAVWVIGNVRVGDLSPDEVRPRTFSNYTNTTGGTGGALNYNDSRLKDTQTTVPDDFIDFPGGDVPIGGNVGEN